MLVLFLFHSAYCVEYRRDDGTYRGNSHDRYPVNGRYLGEVEFAALRILQFREYQGDISDQSDKDGQPSTRLQGKRSLGTDGFGLHTGGTVFPELNGGA